MGPDSVKAGCIIDELATNLGMKGRDRSSAKALAGLLLPSVSMHTGPASVVWGNFVGSVFDISIPQSTSYLVSTLDLINPVAVTAT